MSSLINAPKSKSSPRTRATDLYRRAVRDPSVREAFFVFAITRIFVFVIFVSVGHAVLNHESKPDDPHPVLSLEKPQIARRLRHTLIRGDAGWYLTIATGGYERRPFDAEAQHNWAFFPLYPMLMRAAGAATGEHLIGGALLSNGFFFVALILLHKLVIESGYDERTADRAIFYLAVFPASYFFSIPMTESLFLCLSVASFLAATRGKWWAAGAFGGLASATRVSGVLLLPVLLILYWQRQGGFRLRREILWLALVPAGLLSFMFFLWTITGNPLAFKDVLTAWGRTNGFFLLTLYDYVSSPLIIIEPWNFRLLNFVSAVLALSAVWFWVRRKAWAFAAYTFLSVFLPLSSMNLISMARYISVVFPIFIALAVMGNAPRLHQFIRILFFVLFSLMTISYALRFSFAST